MTGLIEVLGSAKARFHALVYGDVGIKVPTLNELQRRVEQAKQQGKIFCQDSKGPMHNNNWSIDSLNIVNRLANVVEYTSNVWTHEEIRIVLQEILKEHVKVQKDISQEDLARYNEIINSELTTVEGLLLILRGFKKECHIEIDKQFQAKVTAALVNATVRDFSESYLPLPVYVEKSGTVTTHISHMKRGLLEPTLAAMRELNRVITEYNEKAGGELKTHKELVVNSDQPNPQHPERADVGHPMMINRLRQEAQAGHHQFLDVLVGDKNLGYNVHAIIPAGSELTLPTGSPSAVNVCLFSNEGIVLVGNYKGMWMLPGGNQKVVGDNKGAEAGDQDLAETAQAAAMRHLKRETGIAYEVAQQDMIGSSQFIGHQNPGGLRSPNVLNTVYGCYVADLSKLLREADGYDLGSIAACRIVRWDELIQDGEMVKEIDGLTISTDVQPFVDAYVKRSKQQQAEDMAAVHRTAEGVELKAPEDGEEQAQALDMGQAQAFWQENFFKGVIADMKRRGEEQNPIAEEAASKVRKWNQELMKNMRSLKVRV